MPNVADRSLSAVDQAVAMAKELTEGTKSDDGTLQSAARAAARRAGVSFSRFRSFVQPSRRPKTAWMPASGSGYGEPSLPTFVQRQQASKPASRFWKLWELMKLSFESFALSRRISRAELNAHPERPQTDDHRRYHDWH